MIKIIICLMILSMNVFAQNNNFTKDDGSFDWESYLNSDTKAHAYNDTNTLVRLFQYYDEVKDDPFSLSTLSNDIVTKIYNFSNFFNYARFYNSSRDRLIGYYKNLPLQYGYGNTNEVIINNINQILYDNIDKFDVKDKKEKKESLYWFINNQIDERELFDNIRSAYLGEENKLIKIELRNSDNPENGLTIKYNGRVVDGILGEKKDFEYTIDYNGKKDVKIKLVNMRVAYLDNPSLFGSYMNNNEIKTYYNDVVALIIDDNKYLMYSGFRYPTTVQSKIFHNPKIRDLNNHEDGIINVEILK